MKTHVALFWVVGTCTDVGYQRSKGSCFLHLQGSLNPEDHDMNR